MPILILSGSLRKKSFNTQLSYAIKDILTPKLKSKIIDLNNYNFPIFSEDLENQGYPKKFFILRKLFLEAKVFMFCTPEYNGFFPAVLKNTIDWMSRRLPEDKDRLLCFTNKYCAILSASPSELGGARVRPILQQQLKFIRANVFEKTFALGNANDSFEEEAKLILEKEQELKKFINQFLLFSKLI